MLGDGKSSVINWAITNQVRTNKHEVWRVIGSHLITPLHQVAAGKGFHSKLKDTIVPLEANDIQKVKN